MKNRRWTSKRARETWRRVLYQYFTILLKNNKRLRKTCKTHNLHSLCTFQFIFKQNISPFLYLHLELKIKLKLFLLFIKIQNCYDSVQKGSCSLKFQILGQGKRPCFWSFASLVRTMVQMGERSKSMVKCETFLCDKTKKRWLFNSTHFNYLYKIIYFHHVLLCFGILVTF